MLLKLNLDLARISIQHILAEANPNNGLLDFRSTNNNNNNYYASNGAAPNNQLAKLIVNDRTC